MKHLLIALFVVTGTLGYAQELYDLDHIPEIRITFEESNWEELLDQMKAQGDKKRLSATVSIDGRTFQQVGVRYKGNSSYNNPKSKGVRKLPFNLKSNYRIKDQVFPGGYTKIKLSNVFRDASYLREVLSYEIARKYMPAPLVNFAKVYVNDSYLGLYNNTQAVDKVLLEESFGSTGGVFVKCDPEYSILKKLGTSDCPKGDKASLMNLGSRKDCYEGWYEMESDGKKDWDTFIDFIQQLNTPDVDFEDIMNVDMVLWMHAFNNVLVNLDSYTGRLSHNYYLYQTPDGLFTPLVWDMNISLGGFTYDGLKKGALTKEELQTYSMYAHYKTKNNKRPLIVNLLSVPLYRKIYVGHCKTILEENFSNGEYLVLAEKIRTTIDQAVKEDPNKLYDYESFRKNLDETVSIGLSEIIGVKELMDERVTYMTGHPLFNGTNPSISEPYANANDGDVYFNANIADAATAWVAYRPSEQTPWKMVEMTNDGTGEWRASVKGKSGMQYYFVAEGNRLATCLPATAAYQPLRVE